MVIFSHQYFTMPAWLEQALAPVGFLCQGDYGVQIFFVLSGYLITSILVREYDTIGRLDFRAFYMRRILRIFPAFYLFLFFLLGLDLAGAIRLSAFQLITAGAHLFNYAPALQLALKIPADPATNYGMVGHLWTLSMEEQFYWLWPVALLVLLRTGKWAWLAAVIVLLPLSRVATYFVFPALRGQVMMMLHTGSDGIFFGCLLALVLARRPEFGQKFVLPTWAIALVPLYVFGIGPVLDRIMPRGFGLIAGLTLLLAVIVVFLANVLLQERAWYHRVLEFAPLVFIGRISYSLYLWQQIYFVPANKTWLAIWPINILAAFVTAWISYRYLEQPFLRLKDRIFAALL
jgi:peptidoglycan/LPS O-acetylase OafA/YrhL